MSRLSPTAVGCYYLATLASLGLLNVGAAVAPGTTSPPVKIALRTSWHAPPSIIETLETITLEAPDVFFTLLSVISDPKSPTNYKELSPEAAHRALVKAATEYGHLTHKEALPFVDMALALHSAVPKIEAFYEYYNTIYGGEEEERCNGGSWVDWYGSVICDGKKLSSLLEELEGGEAVPSLAQKPKLLPFDHINPNPEQLLDRASHTAVLYGSIDSPNFHALHSSLLSASSKADPQVEYVFRHIPPKNQGEGKSYLTGYGVALDLKKMDYLAVDDRVANAAASKTSEANTSAGIDEKATEDAVIAAILAQSKLTPEQSKAIDFNAPLTKDEIADLGYQATHLLTLASPASPALPNPSLTTKLLKSSAHPFSLLHRLSQNFPRYTALLSRHLPRTPRSAKRAQHEPEYVIGEDGYPVEVPASTEDSDPQQQGADAQEEEGAALLPESLTGELEKNGYAVPPGTSHLWLNGLPIPLGASSFAPGASTSAAQLTPWDLIRRLKKERELVEGLMTLGLTGMSRNEAVRLLTHPAIAKASRASGGGGGGGPLDGLVDASDREEHKNGEEEGEGRVIIYWNDIEKDARYRNWSSSLYQLLKPMYPGSYAPVKLNLYNVILVVDFSSAHTLSFLAGPVASIVERNYPFRFGVVPDLGREGERGESLKAARLFYHLVHNYGRKTTLEFFKTIVRADSPSIQWPLVRQQYEELLATKGGGLPIPVNSPSSSPPDDLNDLDNSDNSDDSEPRPGEGKARRPIPLDKVLAGESSVRVPEDKVRRYLKRVGVLTSEAEWQKRQKKQEEDGKVNLGSGFVNGKYFDLDENFFRVMQNELTMQMNYLQQEIYDGKIADTFAPQQMSTYFYDRPTTVKRRNAYIVPKSSLGSPGSGVRIWNLVDLFHRTGFRSSPWTYLYPEGTSDMPVSMYVIADLDTEEGMGLVKEALTYLSEDVGARVTFIHNPTVPVKISLQPLSTTWDGGAAAYEVPFARLFAYLVYENLGGTRASPRLLMKALDMPFLPAEWQPQTPAEALELIKKRKEERREERRLKKMRGEPVEDDDEDEDGSKGQSGNSPSSTTSQTVLAAFKHLSPTRPSTEHPVQVPILKTVLDDEDEDGDGFEWDEDELGKRPERMRTIVSRYEALMWLTKDKEPWAWRPSEYKEWVLSCRRLAREWGVKPGENAVVANGRLIGPFKKQPGEFVADDFKVLEQYETRKLAAAVQEAVEDVFPNLTFVKTIERPSFSNLVSLMTSLVASTQQPDPSEAGLFDAPPRPRSMNYQMLGDEHTVLRFGRNETALYHITALLDPLSESAQKWTPILEWLSVIPGVYIEIRLNPGRYEEIPLKRFYRFNLSPGVSFTKDGYEKPAEAIFSNLPIDPIYTLAMDVPPSWLVRPREALYDLDNIQLGKLAPEDHAVDAIFELDYIVVEGHARETPANTPPRGLQLQLLSTKETTPPASQGQGQESNGGESEDAKPIADTQVMANLGYIQFKTKPGVYKLEIRPGRGQEIYQMESVGNEGWDSKSIDVAGSEITVTSFEGVTLYPRVRRREGMEKEDVLMELGDKKTDEGLLGGLKSKFKSVFGGKEPQTGLAKKQKQADINIFTVASGLLYERFVSIMILSVLRNTKSTVKFWFIENFLSPSFLEFIPHLAEAYNFQYELVTYKWPSWLRDQKEKQRIIWGYKILYLDVLFPMDLKKVIFVDADQIVRADLKELIDLDLKGAPYGYTPMGDDNTDMEGFRFWKMGYWKDFLRGKPYHISALYVVDLVRFRQLAAGDKLRGQYHHLSADPNSLANLDQDLPNNLQNEVPIFSLHEDWLWCETWCSKDRLHRAKTIDLCQNPLTKEPKLARARQIPEWEEYDGEIARFARKLASEGKIKSRIATAGVDALAGGPAHGSASIAEAPVAEVGENSKWDKKEEVDDAERERPHDEL